MINAERYSDITWMENTGNNSFGTFSRWMGLLICRLCFRCCYHFKSDGKYNKELGAPCENQVNNGIEYGLWFSTDDNLANFQMYNSPYITLKSVEKEKMILVWGYQGWGFEYTYGPC